MRFEFYAIVAAIGFGLNAVLVRLAMKDTTPVTATLSVAAVQVVILSGILVLSPPEVNWVAIGYFALAGFFAAIMGRTFNYMSIDKLGVAISTSLTGTNPIFVMIISVIFLGEKVSVSTVAGSLLVVAGVMLISGWGKDGNLKLGDLVIPLASAFFYAASSVVRKVGLNILPESVLGAAVGALTGLVTYPILLRLISRTGEFKFSRKALPFLVGSGIATSTAWIGMFMATQQGSVSVVSAIIGANPLFGLLLSALLLRDTEQLSKRVIAGCLVIVAGVTVITLL
ncbi:MAG: DMT family transporter [Candidatus Bathyarchaeota archaeon]|nr:DMT family transporter [Candidatus Bathyarchaeota archaeon]